MSMEDTNAKTTLSMIDQRGLLISMGVLTLLISALVQYLSQGTVLFLRAEGHSSEIIGLVFLASVPWILKFLWAPVVDRWGHSRLGHYKGWVLGTQLALVIGVLGLAFVDPGYRPLSLISALVVLTIILSTQQTALFGLVGTYLHPEKRPFGMSVQAVAFALASVFVGGGILYVFGDFGWMTSTLAMSVLMAAGLVLIFALELDKGQTVSAPPPSLAGQFSMFRHRGPRRLLMIAVLTNFGGAATFGLQSILLIDAGYSVSEGALISVVATGLVGIVGAAISGVIVIRVGPFLAIALAALCIFTVCIIYGVFAESDSLIWLLPTVILANSFFMYALMPATKTALLRHCEPGRAATDYTTFAAGEAVFFMGGMALAASVADSVEPGLLFVIYAALTLGGGLAAFFEHRKTQRDALETAP